MSIKKYIKRGVKYVLTGEPINHITTHIVTLAPNELLKGRTALITGGTAGIGLAIAKKFLQSGADVVITGRTNERLASACEELKQVSATGKVYVWIIEMYRLFRSTLIVFQRKLEVI